MTGLGFANPVVSMIMPSSWDFCFSSERIVRMRSPRTTQQMQPLLSSMSSSSPETISSPSMLISPNSLTIIANFLPERSDNILLRRLVFPAPRNPVRTVTGILLSVMDLSDTNYCHGIRETCITSPLPPPALIASWVSLRLYLCVVS